MVEIKICIGSSCFLKNSQGIVEFFQNKIAQEGLEQKVSLSGSFCAGKCNRIGVTIHINDVVYTGITLESINEFWNKNVIPLLK